MSGFVVDSSAVLAVIQKEPGGEDVTLLATAQEWSISSVNYAEVASKLVDRGMPPAEARATIEALDIRVHSFSEVDAMASAALRAATKSLGLSLGDRACLALAQALELPVVTMDRPWATLSLPIEVRVLRPDSA